MPRCTCTHTHTLKSSASHPFTSEQREWTFNCSITKAWSHLGSKSVLISPDHTHSCLSYFLHLRNIIGWVNPHMWHALKIALIWSYAPKMHMYVFQIQKALIFSFCLFFIKYLESAHSYILCSIIRQKFKARYLKVHWITWSTCYFPVSWDHIVTTNIIFYICV